MPLRPLVQTSALTHKGLRRVAYAAGAPPHALGGLGQDVAPAQAGETRGREGDASPAAMPSRHIPPALVKRMRRKLHEGERPYDLQWGPPVKYYKIPQGEDGTVATLKIMKGLVLSKWGHRNPEVIWLAKEVVRDVSPGPAKDYRAMAQAVLDFMKGDVTAVARPGGEARPWGSAGVDYMFDPAGLEYVQTPWYTLLSEGSGDCFVQGTRVLRREGHALVPIESLRSGDEIWGRDRWSSVERVWQKRVLPTYKVLLNNGSHMRFTPDHKVWVARCVRHAGHASPCSCPVGEREIHVEHVENLSPGMVVLQPAEVPFGVGEMDPDRAYIEGLYLSEGWAEGSRFAISGQDGCPKEQLKKNVEAICASLGISTHWHRKYIRVNDPEWTERLRGMGTHAPNKQALSLDLDREPALRFLEGIMADSGKNTNGGGRTFTTTSRELWLQTRVLLKMAGMTCGSAYIEEHGGLGKNPIYRLFVREKNPKRAMKLLRVKEVIRDGLELPCVDVTTDDHCVWLPEVDWTVHQCDDQSVATAALAMALGFRAAFRTVKGDPSRKDQWSHVYPVIGIPNGPDLVWLSADSTQPESYLGWNPAEGRHYGMKTWVIDPSISEGPEWENG